MTTKPHVFTRQEKEIWLDNLPKLNKQVFDTLIKCKKEDKNVVISITAELNDKEIEDLRKMYE